MLLSASFGYIINHDILNCIILVDPVVVVVVVTNTIHPVMLHCMSLRRILPFFLSLADITVCVCVCCDVTCTGRVMEYCALHAGRGTLWWPCDG